MAAENYEHHQGHGAPDGLHLRVIRRPATEAERARIIFALLEVAIALLTDPGALAETRWARQQEPEA